MLTEPQFRVGFNATELEFRRFYGYLLFHTPVGLGTVAGFYFVLYAFLIGGGTLVSVVFGPTARIEPSFFTTGFVTLYFWIACRIYLSHLVREASKLYGGTHTLEISSQGVYDAAERYYSRLMWAAFRRITSTRRHTILYYVGAKAIFIPRSAFPSDEEAEAFLQAAKNWHAAAVPKSIG